MWVNPGPAAVVPSPTALEDMFELIADSPWSAPFLHPRFKEAIKFKLWNTTEQLDGVPEIKDVAEHLKGRKMRVATMCSGTESPLLALNLIQRYILEHFDVTLDYEHVFSCEIEPFKQAYIERNFHPRLLFRDVTELGGTHA